MVATTGLGSLPGTDVGAGVRLAIEVTDLPWLPEFPDRGPWAQMVGRTLGLLVELGAGLSAGEWRLADAPGVDQRRARAALRDDLDLLEENAHDLAGPFRVTVTGPLTLAAATFLPRGGRVVGDRGARRDLAQSLGAGIGDLVDAVARRLPNADVLVQVDEPALPAVLAGAVPTEGGYFRHRAVDRADAVDLLGALGGHALHCCAPGLDADLVRRAGFAAASVDLATLSRADLDGWGEAVESGTQWWLGVVPTAAGGPAAQPDAITRRVLDALRPLELGPLLAERLVLTPACGLAGWRPAEVTRLFHSLRVVAERVTDELSR